MIPVAPDAERVYGLTLPSGETLALIATPGRLMVGIESQDATTRAVFPVAEDPLEALDALARWAEAAATAERTRRHGRPGDPRPR
jgi:hypothetical protein